MRLEVEGRAGKAIDSEIEVAQRSAGAKHEKAVVRDPVGMTVGLVSPLRPDNLLVARALGERSPMVLVADDRREQDQGQDEAPEKGESAASISLKNLVARDDPDGVELHALLAPQGGGRAGERENGGDRKRWPATERPDGQMEIPNEMLHDSSS
jgi:hypothetical protein